MKISFARFAPGDVAPMTRVMKAAFDADSLMHRGVEDGPPGYDDGAFLKKYALDPRCDAYVIHVDDTPMGVAIVIPETAPGEYLLDCLFLDPACHGRGIGTEVWRAIERMYPNARVWRTETPLASVRNLNFYINKCGFMAYRINDAAHYENASVCFVKHMCRGGGKPDGSAR